MTRCFRLLIGVAGLSGALAGLAPAATYYVATNGDDTWAGTSWATAVLTISNGVAKAAASNDVVLVSNGVYVLTGTNINITGAITVQSMSGPAATVVDGNYPVYSNRCFTITHASAVLSGFTLTNACAGNYGSAVYLTAGLVTNCVISGNLVTNQGSASGPVYIDGAAASLKNCTIRGNRCYNSGGAGIYLNNNGLVQDCVIAANTGYGIAAGGISIRYGTLRGCLITGNVGAYAVGMYCNNATKTGLVENCVICNNTNVNSAVGTSFKQDVIKRCIIRANSSSGTGGGVWLNGGASGPEAGGTLLDSVVSDNYALLPGGGLRVNDGGIVRNCLIAGNYSPDVGGGLYIGNYAVNGGYLASCTIVSNRSGSADGSGICFGTACTNSTVITNCIVFSNALSPGPKRDINFQVSSNAQNFVYCACPTYTNFPAGQGNLTNNPACADLAGGDYRLTAGSPCVNAGTNQNWMTGYVDLDNRSRIDRFSGRVDMGAYEHLPHGLLFGSY